MWYSANPTQLATDVQTYLADPPTTINKPIGLVAPHAGYFFSGHVAGATFGGLSPNSFDTVILIGPDHRGAAPHHVSTPDAKIWRTPLGDIPVDWDILNQIHGQMNLTLLPTDEEHSLEVELPFLQTTLKQFNLVPLMMGDQSLPTCQKLSQALVSAIGSNSALLVASSDFSHFFNDTTARQLDEETIQFTLNLDAPGLIRHVEAGRAKRQPLACGSGPIATVMLAAQLLGATQANLLKYATSADVHPDKSRVVGYAALSFTR
jgi:hypothetical protein